MRESTPKTVYLKDYQLPEYLIGSAELTFVLDEQDTRVVSRLTVQKNRKSLNGNAPLVLDGERIILESIKLNGKKGTANRYELTPENLILPGAPKVDVFTLEIETRVNPKANTAL